MDKVEEFIEKSEAIKKSSMTEEEIAEQEKRKEFLNNLSPKYKYKFGVESEYTPGLTKKTLGKRKRERRKKNKESRKARRK